MIVFQSHISNELYSNGFIYLFVCFAVVSYKEMFPIYLNQILFYLNVLVFVY